MKWLDNLKTSTKLFGGFGAVVVLMVIIAVLGYTSVNTVNNNLTSMYNDQTIPIRDVGEADMTLYKLRGDVYNLFIFLMHARRPKLPLTMMFK